MATEQQTRGEVLVESEMIHWQTPPVSWELQGVWILSRPWLKSMLVAKVRELYNFIPLKSYFVV